MSQAYQTHIVFIPIWKEKQKLSFYATTHSKNLFNDVGHKGTTEEERPQGK